MEKLSKLKGIDRIDEATKEIEKMRGKWDSEFESVYLFK